MEPSFGWTLLSQDALRRAEKQLKDATQGVRDEIGFLALHQGYAERFFPGTSVLHTRLRYALFVPWIYEDIARLPDRKRISEVLKKLETRLAGRLIGTGQSGVIGGQKYPNPSIQPPSLIYWTALVQWRILKLRSDGTFPSRQTLNRALTRNTNHQRVQDDDKQSLNEDEPVFCSLPSPPGAWEDESQDLTFELTRDEGKFFRKQLLQVSRPQSAQTPSLLSRLVEDGVELTRKTSMWSREVALVADADDRAALIRAKQTAAMAAIGRGVYSALVEELRENFDGIETGDQHRRRLEGLISRYQGAALQLDLGKVRDDAPTIPESIIRVMKLTQDWLGQGTHDLSSLEDHYKLAEQVRKRQRARLAKTLAGRQRRLVWQPNEHPEAKPLHYRWDNVRQLLIDLQEAK